jgi:hypothetical protein
MDEQKKKKKKNIEAFTLLNIHTCFYNNNNNDNQVYFIQLN